MLFRQYLHRNPVAISYFFGCGSKSQGVVVDPMEDQVDFYIQESRTLGMDIRYVIDTHLHADHISGARLLAEKTGENIFCTVRLMSGSHLSRLRMGMKLPREIRY